MSKQVQVKITRRPRPAPEPSDAPTVSKRLARAWFS